MSDESGYTKNNTDSESSGDSVNHTRFFSHSTRLFRHHIPTEYVLLGVIEFIVLMFAFYIGHEIRFEGGWHAFYSV